PEYPCNRDRKGGEGMGRRHAHILVALVPVLLATRPAPAAEAKTAHSFRVTIASGLVMEVEGRKEKLDADSAFRYTLERRGREVTLLFEEIQTKARQDGRVLMNTTMSRAGLKNLTPGKENEVAFEDAPAKLQQMLRDSFGTPVCKLEVDGNGKELKRRIVAGAGARDLVHHGAVANALLFHAMFPSDRDR